MTNAYFIFFVARAFKPVHEVILSTVEEVHALQASLTGCHASIVEAHYKGGKAQYKWNGEGFRRTLNFTGKREDVSPYNGTFEVSRGNEGSFLLA